MDSFLKSHKNDFDKFDSIIVDNSKKSKFRNLLELKEYEKN